MPLDPRRVKELFDSAVDLPEPADRLAFLDRECGGDRELRERLDALMAAHDKPVGELERPLAVSLDGGSIAAG
jgi:eukaryotic-like serine/threonine-protein kinase